MTIQNERVRAEVEKEILKCSLTSTLLTIKIVELESLAARIEQILTEDARPASLGEKEEAAVAVIGIVRDLTDRGGLRQAWESFDADIVEEIVAKWEEIILRTRTGEATESREER